MSAGLRSTAPWPSPSQGPVPDVPAASGRYSPRRLPVVALLAMLMVVVLGLRWWAAADRGRDVLVVARPVAAGARLGTGDVTTMRLRGGAAFIGASHVNDVVGRTAAVDLLPGTVVVAAMLTDSAVPGAGYALVGVAVERTALPAELAIGARVRVVGVPAGDDPGRALATSARVLSIRVDEDADTVALSLVVTETEADAVARAAASSGVSVFVLPPPGASS